MKPVFKLLPTLPLLLVGLLVCGSLSATPSLREFSKTINKQFNISADGLVNLSNKYGKIDIKTWDKNTVRVSVKILVEAKSEDAAQEVFDRINIKFYNSSDAVRAETEIESKQSSWWDWGNNSDDFSINYEVFMPATANLEVAAKYCDVYSAAIAGTGKFNVKYGNFKIDGLGEDSFIDLSYGNGTILRARDLSVELAYGNLKAGEVSDVDLNMRYGTFEVDRAGDIISESRYSNFRLGEIRQFRDDGKYDNIEIDFAEEVVIETHYTNIEIGRLGRRMNLDMAYGSAKIRKIDASFDEININGRYTDFKFYMTPGTNCSLDLSGTYADLRLPSSGVKTSYDAQSGNTHEIRGNMGSGGNSSIKARLSYGGLMVAAN